jgi:hypothetical protein
MHNETKKRLPNIPLTPRAAKVTVLVMKIKGPSKALRETNEKLSKLPPKQRSVAEILAQVKQHQAESKLEILRAGQQTAAK